MTTSSTGTHDPVVIVVDGELDASDGAWSAELRAALAAGRTRVVVDMLGVSFIDSSVVRQLVEAYRALDAGWLRVVYTHHLIRRVIAICGLADALPQYTSVDAALRGNPSALRPVDEYGYGDLDTDHGTVAPGEASARDGERRGSGAPPRQTPTRQGSTPR